MTLLEAATLAADATYQSRVRVAALQYAFTVQGETPTTHNRVDEKRAALANAVLSDGGVSALTQFCWGMASYPGAAGPLNSNVTDADLNSEVVTLWNDLAGVTGADMAS